MRHYLTGRNFTILSDHRPLVWLDSVVDPEARLLRWRLKLNNFNYEIKFTLNLRKKIIDYIKSCEICQKVKYNRQHTVLPLSLTATVSEPNLGIAFDIIGPFKYPDGRKLYGLTIQDEFSKYIEFCGIKDCAAETIAKALIESWILCYGIPKILVSNNGSNHVGK